MRKIALKLGFGFLVTSCAALPTQQYDGVEIGEIVQRIKCELAYAVPEIKGRYPSGDYQWMKYWTAKIDLSLETNDQAALRPNSTFITPMSQVTLPGVGNISRSFTLGATADLASQNVRTDKLSFTLSMQELIENRRSAICVIPQQDGLLGNLGLQEWTSSALMPVKDQRLTIGYHQPPTGKPSVTPIPGPNLRAADSPVDLLKKAQSMMQNAEEAARRVKIKANEAMAYVLSRGLSPGQKIQGAYDRIDQVYTNIKKANDLVDAAVELGWDASKAYRDSGQQISEATNKALGRIATDAKAATDQITKAKDIATGAWDLLPRDPPIDSITHTVKFILSGGASVTPTWTLVRFKGPGQSNPFVSASRMRTNQLDVVLGQPAVAGGKALSDEQNRQLFNLQLDSLRARLVPLQVQ